MSAEATCVAPGIPPFPAAPISYMQPPSLTHQQYYEYNGSFTGASTSTFRPNKRPRPLTEEEAAAITRNFSHGVGTSISAHLHLTFSLKYLVNFCKSAALGSTISHRPAYAQK